LPLGKVIAIDHTVAIEVELVGERVVFSGGVGGEDGECFGNSFTDATVGFEADEPVDIPDLYVSLRRRRVDVAMRSSRASGETVALDGWCVNVNTVEDIERAERLLAGE
jgi:hypothetical protein